MLPYDVILGFLWTHLWCSQNAAGFPGDIVFLYCVHCWTWSVFFTQPSPSNYASNSMHYQDSHCLGKSEHCEVIEKWENIIDVQRKMACVIRVCDCRCNIVSGLKHSELYSVLFGFEFYYLFYYFKTWTAYTCNKSKMAMKTSRCRSGGSN